MFCLMVGTAALPHVLMRFYTTPTVREARQSVVWSLGFIVLLYVSAPALAVLVKFLIYDGLVGTSFAELPSWVMPGRARSAACSASRRQWRRHRAAGRDPHQPGHHHAGDAGDRRPAVRGFRAGGRGRAGCRAVHRRRPAADHRQRPVARPLLPHRQPRASHARGACRLAKVLLLWWRRCCRVVASRSRPAGVLDMVGAAFSLAAAGFFPALVLGIFWKRATGLGAVAGMLAGLRCRSTTSSSTIRSSRG